MFGESQTSLASSGTSRTILPFIGKRFLIKGCVKKIACLSVSEFAIFSYPTIRNLWGDTDTNTMTFSLHKKACRKGKLLLLHSAKEPLGGVAERGLRGGG